jgi:ketosteroid isomerase-like protein
MSKHLSRLDALLDWYRQLTPASLSRLPEFYTDDAFFKDPFHELQSREQLRHLYSEMFRTLEQPRFEILNTVREGHQAFLIWDMTFSVHGRPMHIHGSSHLVFAEDGRVSAHHDYWDAAEEIYEKLPALGWLIRTIKKRIQAQ